MTLQTTREFRDKHGMGYLIQSGTLGYRFVWKEDGEPDDTGEWFETELGAIKAALEDWRSEGQGDNWDQWSKDLAIAGDGISPDPLTLRWAASQMSKASREHPAPYEVWAWCADWLTAEAARIEAERA